MPIPQFTRDEEKFYEQIRISVKLWQQDYDAIYDLLEQAYSESDHYFGSICKPIAQKLHLYDIYGVDTVNGALCGKYDIMQILFTSFNMMATTVNM